MSTRYIGRDFNRVDGMVKADGSHKYPSDYREKDMLVLGVKRADVPHGNILSINSEKARQVPGVTAIFTARDIPGTNRYGIVRKDQEILVERKVRSLGDAICLVAGESREAVEEAVKLIHVQYDVLPVVTDPFAGLQEDAPRIHDEGNLYHHVESTVGDVEAAFREADAVVEADYSVPFQDHMPLETEAGWGKIDEDGKIAIWAGTQSVYRDVAEIAHALNIPKEDIRVSAPFFGGGFGRKDGINVQLFLALAVLKLKRPVRIFYDRSESITSSYHRHAAFMHYKTAARKDGTLLACQAKLYFDKGAYASLGAEVLNLAAEHFAGPYKVPNAQVEGWAVYTNNPVGGAFRGFGVPQVTFAFEQQMDMLAEKINMDKLQFRKKNAIEQWDKSCIGHTFIYSTGMKECLDAIGESDLWKNREKHLKTESSFKKRGIGLAASYQGGGLGVNIPDFAKGKIELLESGDLLMYGAISDMGQGNTTGYVQIVAELFDVDRSRVRFITPDTKYTLEACSAAASRTTYIYGKALEGAASILKDRMKNAAAGKLEENPVDMDIRDGKVIGRKGSLSFKDICSLLNEKERVAIAFADMPVAIDRKDVACGLPHILYSHAVHAALVEVDTLTGKVEIIKYVTATECGKVINPQQFQAQIHGGTGQGIGYALSEGLKLQGCKVVNDRMSTYVIPGMRDVPEIETMAVEPYETTGVFGMKGVGEISMDSPAPAICNAVWEAVGYRCFSLPVTAEKILMKK